MDKKGGIEQAADSIRVRNTMKIYTKTGDKGETSLFTGERVPKSHQYIEALGAVDECNSLVGSAIAFFPKDHSLKSTQEQLIIIQHALFDVGAALATPRKSAGTKKLEKTRFDHEAIDLLEAWIDQMEKELPKLTHFILPGGHPAGAMLHVARSMCRRAERCVVPLNQQEDVSDNVLVYLNRLSDYLFVASRFVNHVLRVPETQWEPHKVVEHTL